jgi:hypothetical protein
VTWLGWVLGGVLATIAIGVAVLATLMRMGVGYAFAVALPDPAHLGGGVRWAHGRVKHNHPLGRFIRHFGMAQIVLGRTIYNSDDGLGAEAFAHEIVHIWQFERYGWAMVPYYLRPFVKRFERYRDNWAEREARAYAAAVYAMRVVPTMKLIRPAGAPPKLDWTYLDPAARRAWAQAHGLAA